MDKIDGKYLGQDNQDFPLDCETLEYIAENRRLTELLGYIAGDKVILSGCAETGTEVSEGYVFVNGEVMRFTGGTRSSYVKVAEESISVTSDGKEYQAYIKRWLTFGTGDGQMKWADFYRLDGQNLKTLAQKVKELKTKVDSMQGVPVGTIEMWAGGNTLPEKYILCDGKAYDNNGDYKELYDVIGNTFNEAEGAQIPGENQFCVPNLQGRFIVGQTPTQGSKYATKGTTGGKDEVKLELNQIPAHSHNMEHIHDISHTHKYTRTDWNADDWDGGSHGGTIQKEVDTGDSSERYSGNILDKETKQNISTTADAGGGGAHENRPPFYVLAYIIKYKL